MGSSDGTDTAPLSLMDYIAKMTTTPGNDAADGALNQMKAEAQKFTVKEA